MNEAGTYKETTTDRYIPDPTKLYLTSSENVHRLPVLGMTPAMYESLYEPDPHAEEVMARKGDGLLVKAAD